MVRRRPIATVRSCRGRGHRVQRVNKRLKVRTRQRAVLAPLPLAVVVVVVVGGRERRRRRQCQKSGGPRRAPGRVGTKFGKNLRSTARRKRSSYPPEPEDGSKRIMGNERGRKWQVTGRRKGTKKEKEKISAGWMRKRRVVGWQTFASLGRTPTPPPFYALIVSPHCLQ